MSIPDLKTALYEGTVLFEFIKKDGTLRHARGTTSPDLIPAKRNRKKKQKRIKKKFLLLYTRKRKKRRRKTFYEF